MVYNFVRMLFYVRIKLGDWVGSNSGTAFLELIIPNVYFESTLMILCVLACSRLSV